MKMAKVVRLAKQNSRVRIFQKYTEKEGYTGPQWLSVGGAIYNLEGMPKITSEDEFRKVFDIKEGKCAITIEDLPEDVNFDRWDKSEVSAEPIKMTIGIENDVLRVFKYEGGSMIVRAAYLEPFADSMDILYAARKLKDGTPFLCVEDGILLGGIIMPLKVDYAEKNRMKNTIKGVLNELERSLAWDRVNAKQK